MKSGSLIQRVTQYGLRTMLLCMTLIGLCMPAAIQWWQKPALEELVEEHTRLMTRQVFSQATKVAELAISEYPESELARFMLVNTSLGELEARLSTIQFTCTVDDARPLSMPNAEEWNELTKRHAQKSSLRNQSHD